MADAYRFSDPAGLDERWWYSYVPYTGADFVAGWRADRDRAAALLPPPCPPPPAKFSLPGIAPFPAGVVLDWLWTELPGGDDRARVAYGRLLARFEVTRKVAAALREDFRPLDPAERGPLSAHLRLAELFARCHEQERSLRHLNALIKAVDTLIALAAGMDEGERARLSGLIAAERAAIVRLADRIGVEACR